MHNNGSKSISNNQFIYLKSTHIQLYVLQNDNDLDAGAVVACCFSSATTTVPQTVASRQL